MLSLLDVICAVAGIVGVWLSLRRRAYGRTLLFLALQLPMPFVIAANQCDVMPVCEATQWAVLPRPFFEPAIRVRGVSSTGEATVIAAEALHKAGLNEEPGVATLEAGKWVVPTYLGDNPGRHFVVIDARTGKADIADYRLSRIEEMP